MVVSHQWDHDFWNDVDPFPREFTRRLHNRPRLGLIDLRERDPQAAATMPQHWVKFVKRITLRTEPFSRDTEFGSKVRDLFVSMREELMQRWVEQTNCDRQSGHRPQNTDKIALLHGDNLTECANTAGGVFGENHLTHGVDTISLEEHMLGATQADAFSPKRACDRGIVRRVGICAHPQPTETIRPAHECFELRSIRVRIARRDLATEHFPSGPIKGDPFICADYYL